MGITKKKINGNDQGRLTTNELDKKCLYTQLTLYVQHTFW